MTRNLSVWRLFSSSRNSVSNSPRTFVPISVSVFVVWHPKMGRGKILQRLVALL